MRVTVTMEEDYSDTPDDVENYVILERVDAGEGLDSFQDCLHVIVETNGEKHMVTVPYDTFLRAVRHLEGADSNTVNSCSCE